MDLAIERFGSNGSTTICSVPLISALQNGHPWPSESYKPQKRTIKHKATGVKKVLLVKNRNVLLTICHDVKQGVQSKWPQGSIRISLSFSAQILHNWKVLPISQYNSYCSWVTDMWSSGLGCTAHDKSGFKALPSGYK